MGRRETCEHLFNNKFFDRSFNLEQIFLTFDSMFIFQSLINHRREQMENVVMKIALNK